MIPESVNSKKCFEYFQRIRETFCSVTNIFLKYNILRLDLKEVYYTDGPLFSINISIKKLLHEY